MPNIFVENKDRWLALAESESEFPILFIRAWIPFNAWYCNTYPDKKNKDRPILDTMKSDSNLFRTRIIALLQGTDADALNFRNALAQLHYSLEKYYIPNAANRITFSNISFRLNPQTSFSKRYKGYDYKAEVVTVINPSGNSSLQVKADIIEVSTTNFKYRYPQRKYDRTHFIADINDPTKSLTQDMRNIIEGCFDNVNPQKEESVILANRRGAMMVDKIPFVNDADLISKAIIELLYKLRCILFHGEVQPSKDNLSVYEHAYYLLRILLKSLR